MMRRVGWVVFLFLLGCSGPGAASFPEALALDDFAETLAAARCEQARTCAAAETAGTCEGAAPDPRVALARAGRLVYDEVAAGACTRVVSTSCPTVDGTPASGTRLCDEAFAPAVVASIGASCVDSIECGPAAHCAEVEACGSGGVCVSLGRNGDPCTSDRGCEPEHDGAPQRCVLGQCAHLYDAPSDTVCGPQGVGTGDLVTSSVTPRCTEPGVCLQPTDEPGRCVPVVEAGAACGPGTGACDGGSCTAGVCGALRPLGPGDACRTGSDACGRGLRCELGVCVPWAGRLGEGCEAALACGPGLTCTGGMCLRPGPSLGEPCTDLCGEGTCTAGVCVRQDGCVRSLPPDVSCAVGWPEAPSVLAYAECGPSGPTLRFVVTPEPLGCGEAPPGAYYELLGPGALPVDGGMSVPLVWYDDATNHTGDARFCVAAGSCSELVSTRWNVDPLDTDFALSLAAICNDLRGVLVSLRRFASITVCNAPPTCP